MTLDGHEKICKTHVSQNLNSGGLRFHRNDLLESDKWPAIGRLPRHLPLLRPRRHSQRVHPDHTRETS
jgi:hypothetical protein